jgi:hypothetical protein
MRRTPSRPYASPRLVAALLLVAGILANVPAADVAWAGKSTAKSGEGARGYVLESKRSTRRRHHRGPRILLPLGPSYTYYDYPYYYSRGHYPTHIGGYVYYYPAAPRPRKYRRWETRR